jgi:hypothetical protein
VADQFALVILNGQMERLPVTDRLKVGAGIVFDNSNATIDDIGGILYFTDINGSKALTAVPVVGNAEIDFGAMPGNSTMTLAIADAAIAAGSIVGAQILAKATVDHSLDEHIADPPQVYAGNVVAGVGFTIYGSVTQSLGPTTYGKWSVSWSRT